MLNTFHLRTFLAVIDAGNYTAAADQLHMSQPAVSQHIHALEEQLGAVRLFRRVGQRMVTTHAGEELLPLARELVALAERAEQNILALRGQVTGRVVLGCTPNSGEVLLPPLLTHFRALYPAISLAVQVRPSDQLLELLAAQELALVLIEEQQRRRSWESSLLGNERLVLTVPLLHPLTHMERIPYPQLREYPLVLPSTTLSLRRTIEDGLRRRGVALTECTIALESDSTALLLQAVRNGLGIAFVPETQLGHMTGVTVVELSGNTLQQEWYLVRPRERNLPRAILEAINFLEGPEARAILTHTGLRVNLADETARG